MNKILLYISALCVFGWLFGLIVPATGDIGEIRACDQDDIIYTTDITFIDQMNCMVVRFFRHILSYKFAKLLLVYVGSGFTIAMVRYSELCGINFFTFLLIFLGWELGAGVFAPISVALSMNKAKRLSNPNAAFISIVLPMFGIVTLFITLKPESYEFGMLTATCVHFGGILTLFAWLFGFGGTTDSNTGRRVNYLVIMLFLMILGWYGRYQFWSATGSKETVIKSILESWNAPVARFMFADFVGIVIACIVMIHRDAGVSGVIKLFVLTPFLTLGGACAYILNGVHTAKRKRN